MPRRKISRFQDLPPKDTKDYQKRLEEWIEKQPPSERKYWRGYKGATKKSGIGKFDSGINYN